MKEFCLVTVTSETFIPGTLVMIHSFLKHNPWFKRIQGDIVILHDSVPDSLRTLADVFDRVTWLQVSSELKQTIADLCEGVPELRLHTRSPRFFSLDLFRLSGYSRVLFCDSDLLFLKSVEDLCLSADFEEGDGCLLFAARDRHSYRETPIDAGTFTPATDGSGADTIERTFNAGFMFMDGRSMSPDQHERVLSLMDVARWKKIRVSLTDQVVFNLFFRERICFFDARFNYLINHRDRIQAYEAIPLDEIRVLHFIGKDKPWDLLKTIEFAVNDPEKVYFSTLWHKAFLDLLPRFHLVGKLKGKIGKAQKQGMEP